MKAQGFGLFRFILIFVAVFALIRFLLVIMRVGQAMTLGTRAYWLAVVPATVCLWVVWKLRRRSRATQTSEHLFKGRMRDVTNSFRG